VDVGVAHFPDTSAVGNREQPGIGATTPVVSIDPPALQTTSPAGVNFPASPNGSQQTQDAPRGISRAVFTDPQTNTLVFQSLDPSTGDVIEQVPAPALLRQLAYEGAQATQALIQGKDPNAAMLAAMQKIDITT
jgi:hypothetical protein